ncbi:AAA family ATPase [Pedobacter sp. ASV1-7]|uniref:AAA family ATPase n=1 Tax=Pedobacter sp. ASV1-7 TaxID=3145237 RepID=UPI0032E92B6B
MRIKQIHLKDFKRFTDLQITNLPNTAKLIVLVGPNGSGKTSLFEAFNHFYKLSGYNSIGMEDYCSKKDSPLSGQGWHIDKVGIDFHETFDKAHIKDKFYFRTAYRNEHDFTVNNLKAQKIPTESFKFDTLNGNDLTVSENYQRLISQTLAGVFNSTNNSKTVEQYREELIGEIKQSLNNVFDDLTLSSIGDPLSNGSFYFNKGNSKDFHYKNLSAGEKSAFDLLLDLIIKSKYYTNTIFCIDEPEAHMHTRLQSKLLAELYRLIPDHSQLWISTHSIGMLKQAEELELAIPNSVTFLDFDNRDFDSQEVITPTKISKSIWNRFFELALSDFSKLISPRQIVFCEGTQQGRKCQNFDAQIYGKIFEQKYHDTSFISLGSCSEIEDLENQSVKLLSSILKASTIIKFVDRDDKSDTEVSELLAKNIKTLEKRHIENYLLDNEIIEKLCIKHKQEEKIELCLKAKQDAINDSISRNNPKDDVKSASGKIYTELKQILNLTQCGNNTVSFLRDTMAPLITEETNIFKELEKQIFTPVSAND